MLGALLPKLRFTVKGKSKKAPFGDVHLMVLFYGIRVKEHSDSHKEYF